VEAWMGFDLGGRSVALPSNGEFDCVGSGQRNWSFRLPSPKNHSGNPRGRLVVEIPHKSIETGIAGEFRRTSAAPALSFFAALRFAFSLGLAWIMPHHLAAGIENVERDLIVLRSVGCYLRLLFRARLSWSATGLSCLEFRILRLLARSRSCSFLLRLLAFDCGL